MRRLALFFLIIALSWTIAVAANSGALRPPTNAPDWERYTAAGEEFSVLLPKPPTIASFSRPLRAPAATKSGTLYAAYEDGTGYVVVSFENDNNEEALDVFLAEFPEYGVFNPGATFERELKLNGYQGKQYRVKSSTSDVTGIVQFYQTGKHVYLFEAVGDERSQPAIERFLKSVTFDLKAQAKDSARLQASTEAARESSFTPPPDKAQNQTMTTPLPETFSPKEVTRKAVLVARGEPMYTEEARRNSISGVVVLKAVFSSSGQVTNIRAVSGLPYGLTEKAMTAARQITFIPALKDGRFVSQYIQIEYNFNLY